MVLMWSAKTWLCTRTTIIKVACVSSCVILTVNSRSVPSITQADKHCMQTSITIWPYSTEYFAIYVNNYPTKCSYIQFMSVNCSTCFGWYLHPSSGAHVTVSTASDISKTVTATCRELRSRDWTGTLSFRPVTFTKGGSYGLTNARLCGCSDMSSWWWVEIPPEACTAVYRHKLYIVVSFWIVIDIYSWCTDSWAWKFSLYVGCISWAFSSGVMSKTVSLHNARLDRFTEFISNVLCRQRRNQFSIYLH
jgi:hypothetical protein